MTTQEASTLLFKNGVHVDKLDRTLFRVWDVGGSVTPPWYARGRKSELWTGREVIRYARSFQSSDQQPSLNKTVKKLSNSKDRSLTRDLIKGGKFNEIPLNKRTKSEDRWGWD